MTYRATVSIPVARPFHAPALLRFLADRAVAGVELVDRASYARTIALSHGPASVVINFAATGSDTAAGEEAAAGEETASGEDAATSDGPCAIPVTVHLADPADLDEAVARCRHLLGAEVDAAAVHRALLADPALAAGVAAAPGIRVPGAVDGPEILIRALVGQQVSVAAARTALGRLTAAAGRQVASLIPGLTHLFPDPAGIAALGVDAIAGPRRRAAAIAAAAADMARGDLLVDAGRAHAELTAALVARDGIGPWTAGYVAMRVLAEPDVLLTGDVALRHGAAALGIASEPRALATHGERWSPYRSFAGMYLWRACPPPTRRGR